MKNIGTSEIKTERLQLRKFNLLDVDSTFKNWASDEEVQTMYLEPTYKTKESVRNFIKKYISAYKDNYYRWAIILKETNECIGQIAFFLVDTDNHFAEVEYCIGRNFQKMGYAKEALNAVINFAFKEMQLNKIQVSHMKGNNPSKNLILSCNFKFEGNAREYFYKDGKYIDRLYYSILRSEWRNK